MPEFDESRWADKEFARKYLEAADVQIVERRRLLRILQSFCRYFLGDKKGNRALDLGCGDGVLTAALLEVDGHISATLVDGSEEMLHRAKKRLAGFSSLRFIRANFQELLRGKVQLPAFDLVVSAFAVHHLTTDEKKALFGFAYSRLGEGGAFVNLDVVLAPTDALKGWYLKLWEEWIAEKQTALELAGDYTSIIRNYKEPNHYRNLDTITDQLTALKEAGFKDVDCFYSYGVFVVYGGRK
ncbi:MAG: methyltransferase [Bacillota bacterium]